MTEVTLKKVIVTKEVAAALDRIPNDDWNKQFDLISMCKNFSGNGVRMKATFNQDAEALNQLSPLEFARCLVIGYETEEPPKRTDCVTANGKDYVVGDIVVVETARAGRRVMVIDKLNYSSELIKEIVNDRVQISARAASIKGLATEEEIVKEIQQREEETSAQQDAFNAELRLLRESEKHLAVQAYTQQKLKEQEESSDE
ncbi:hypothetical protein [Bacillus paranthracis]|uniref:hypothetical protein n=1 Tax=Bacillus paranthracis TaxID=2026186 RepID=UPI0022E081E2|nr:hypothetical protein [Bacillus paranthracis]